MYYEEELAVHNSVMQFYQTIYNETKKWKPTVDGLDLQA